MQRRISRVADRQEPLLSRHLCCPTVNWPSGQIDLQTQKESPLLQAGFRIAALIVPDQAAFRRRPFGSFFGVSVAGGVPVEVAEAC